MRIGVPNEIKNLEFRVSVTPEVAKRLTNEGHEVVFEAEAASSRAASASAWAACR